MTDDNILKLPDVNESNRRHDQQHGDPYQYNQTRTRCGWNTATMSRKGKLTDKTIQKYQEQGFYSAEYKAARRELAEKRSKKRVVRDGNFDIVDGRMIYRPA